MCENSSIFLLGTYMPQKCGIATFTTDLFYALKKNITKKLHAYVLAVGNGPEKIVYPAEVVLKIQEKERADYIKAAEYVNNFNKAYILLQHEFGIFGGENGEYILSFIEKLKKPLICTFHTIVENPAEKQKKIIQKICSSAQKVVVMSQKAVSLLKSIYQVDPKKIVFIAHGTYTSPPRLRKINKLTLGFFGRKVLLTCGLLNRNKGIELVLEALKQIVKKVPKVLYIVLGATHPKIKVQEDEKYRLSLMDYVKKQGLENNVLFVDRFCDVKNFKRFLSSADLYIASYRSREQVVSGTLAYALASGKAIISTPSWYAEEVLSNGRGVLIPFGNSEALAKAITDLLLNDKKRKEIEKQAYKFGKKTEWKNIGKKYLSLFSKLSIT